MNLGLLLDIPGSMEPDRVIASDREHSLTYAQLTERALILAGMLLDLETPGPLAYVGENSCSVLIGLYGAAFAGRAFAPLNYRADKILMEHYLQSLRPV